MILAVNVANSVTINDRRTTANSVASPPRINEMALLPSMLAFRREIGGAIPGILWRERQYPNDHDSSDAGVDQVIAPRHHGLKRRRLRTPAIVMPPIRQPILEPT